MYQTTASLLEVVEMRQSDLDKILANNPDLARLNKPAKTTTKRRGGKTGATNATEEGAVQIILAELVGYPQPVREYKFLDNRRFRFDLAWPELKMYCEIEGGVWMKTANGRSAGHAHPKRFESDCEKYNLATIEGWRGVRGSVGQVKSGRVGEWLRGLLDAV